MRDDVYEELKRRIVELEARPGQILHEKELADAFSVSRTPIREALIRLESEGLVDLTRGRSAQVTEVSLHKLRDSFEMRSFLADLVGRLVASRATEAQWVELESLIERIEAETDAGTLRSLDLAFHDRLNHATGNALLVETLARLRNLVSRVWDMNVPTGEDHGFTGIGAEFRLVLAAARARDGEEIARLLRRHLSRFVLGIIGFSSEGRSEGGRGSAAGGAADEGIREDELASGEL